jgi:hypothetical protein
MKIRLRIMLAVSFLSCCAAPVLADYTFVLKNGRRITAQSYREEGSMVKIYGLGGELGIPKDQIQTILKAEETQHQGLSVRNLEAPRQATAPPTSSSPIPSAETKETLRSDETESTTNAEEAKEYQKRLAEVTQKLEAARQEYFNVTQGGGTSSNVGREGLKSWTMDLASRIHDSQRTPGGGGTPSTPPTPPYAPSYTPREKELSDLRMRIDSLEKERDDLIQKMKSKNIPTENF